MTSPRGRSSRFLLDWNALDGLDYQGRLVARTGQVATFDRGGTVGSATSVDVNGKIFTPGYKTPRFYHQYNATTGLWEPQGVLLEESRANVCLQSEDFGTTWTVVGTPTRTAAAHTASGVSLDLIGDDSGAANEYYYQPITFTGNAAKAISVFCKAGTSQAASGSDIALWDNTASAYRLRASLTWSSGVPTATIIGGAGTYIGYDLHADGVYRLLFTTSTVTAANDNQVFIVPCRIAAEQGNLYAGGVQCENATFPSRYIKTTTTVTRSADSCSFAYNPALADFTVLLSAYVFTSQSGVYDNLLNIGSNTDGAEIYMGTSVGAYAEIRGTPNAPGTAQTVTPGGLTRFCAQFKDWGTGPTCRLDIGTGFAAWSSASNARTALGAATLRLNTGSNGSGCFAYRGVRVAAGLQTYAYMVAG